MVGRCRIKIAIEKDIPNRLDIAGPARYLAVVDGSRWTIHLSGYGGPTVRNCTSGVFLRPKSFDDRTIGMFPLPR